jgi:DTW domain-containing protein YfiP
MYGDPMEVYAAKQAREKRQAAQPASKRHTLTLKSRKTDGEWSEARKAAEALFDLPAAASR